MAVLLLLILVAVLCTLLVRGGRGRALVLNGGLVLASIGLTILGTEIVLRFFFSERFHPLIPSAERGLFWQYDPDLGWAHKPKATGNFRKPGVFDTSVTINSRGFRDLDRAERAPAGVRRIVVLGDSIVWGYGVEDREVFTRVMERDRPGLEVINLGVSGYGTDQESLLLEREGMRYGPHLVLAEVCENDFAEIVRDQVYHIYPKPLFAIKGGSLALTNTPVPRASSFDRFFYRLETDSYLWRLVTSSSGGARLVDRFRVLARKVGLSRAAPPPLASSDQQERLQLALLARSNEIARRGGAHMAVFLVAPMPAAHRTLVRRFCEQQGIAVMDLTPVFESAGAGGSRSSLFLRGDLHWTPEGHRITASALERWIQEGGILGNPQEEVAGAGVGVTDGSSRE